MLYEREKHNFHEINVVDIVEFQSTPVILHQVGGQQTMVLALALWIPQELVSEEMGNSIVEQKYLKHFFWA